jgi:ABC-type uncharacterized transport system ATPase subunit
MTPSTQQPAAIAVRGLLKRYPGVIANRDVSLDVRRGEIHAIVGENGAGKSTLMKALYGMTTPDAGEIRVDGEPVQFRSPADAIAAGIGMVHQHFMLAENLTVLENIVLGWEPRRGLRLDRRAAVARIEQLSRDYGMALEPDRLVAELGVGQRQRVEIAKVLFRGARILILDEPTAVLVPQEVDELFRNLRELKGQGVTVIFISHKLDEVQAAADTVTVMRAGTTVATLSADELSPAKLALLMIGRDLPTPARRAHTVGERVALAAEGLVVLDEETSRPRCRASLRVHAGEIVGVAGVEGNGQTELVEGIVGLRALHAGRLEIGGRDVTHAPTAERRRAGLAYIPEDRHRQALLLDARLWENRVLGYADQPPFRRGPLVDHRAARADTAELIEQLGVKASSVEDPAFALSGGNQQKLVFGRELRSSPNVLIACNPTRGIDIGAQADIWQRLKDAADAGLAVLLISADLTELLGLSDRLHVMFGGRLVAELVPHDADAETLGTWMTGASSDDDGAEAA